jgi:outer membrane protein OmpA-like peptidoglycan-associated protein
VRLDGALGRLHLRQPVAFRPGDQRILPRSEPAQAELQAAVAAEPSIREVRIDGHADLSSADVRDLALARRRARSVLRWMLARSAGARLVAWGCGAQRPVGTAGRQRRGRLVRVEVLMPRLVPGNRPWPEVCEGMVAW